MRDPSRSLFQDPKAPAPRPAVPPAASPQSSSAELFDAAVIGGGPAGSALAALLARSGRRTALFERDSFPRDKLCGEFLSFEAQRHLADLGCLEDVLALGPARIGRARFTATSGRMLETDLPAECLGIGRQGLDAVLFRHAGRCGAALFEGAEVVEILPAGEESADGGPQRSSSGIRVRVRGSGPLAPERIVRAPLLAGAWGRREALDLELGRRFIARDHPFLGIKRHLVPADGGAGAKAMENLAGTAEVHSFAGGYCGFTPVEGGAVNFCVLLTKRAVARFGSTRWEVLSAALAAANPHLGNRLQGLLPADDRVLGVGQVPFCLKEQSLGPLLLLGDAAGMIAPFCGDGQAMALESAALLSELLQGLPRAPTIAQLEALAREWSSRWRRTFLLRMRIGRALQPLLFRPSISGLAIGVLGCFPSLTAMLARCSRGTFKD